QQTTREARAIGKRRQKESRAQARRAQRQAKQRQKSTTQEIKRRDRERSREIKQMTQERERQGKDVQSRAGQAVKPAPQPKPGNPGRNQPDPFERLRQYSGKSDEPEQ